MTPERFIDAVQEALGGGYVVSRHPVERAEPQFDVHPDPLVLDDRGNAYRSTFSVRTADLDGFEGADVLQFAARAARDLSVQRKAGKAPPLWRGSRV